MNEKSKNTRTEIIDAAQNEFLTHGYEGARLQAIADHIGVTKAMIHYYFHTKKELFEHVYKQSVNTIFGDLNELLSRDLPLFNKIELLIEHCLEKSERHPLALSFVITESGRKPEWLQPIFREEINLQIASFSEELKEAASNYQVTSVSVTGLLLNIFSLSYYPVIAQPVHQSLINEDIHTPVYDPQKRKGVVLDTILNWLTA